MRSDRPTHRGTIIARKPLRNGGAACRVGMPATARGGRGCSDRSTSWGTARPATMAVAAEHGSVEVSSTSRNPIWAAAWDPSLSDLQIDTSPDHSRNRAFGSGSCQSRSATTSSAPCPHQKAPRCDAGATDAACAEGCCLSYVRNSRSARPADQQGPRHAQAGPDQAFRLHHV